MRFVKAGYVESVEGEVKTYTKAYTRQVQVAFYGEMQETVEVRAEIWADGLTVVRVTKNGRQLHPNRGSHLYKSEGVAYAAVKATVEWLGYTI